MRDLAERILPVYQERDPDRYLSNLSALQMAVGDYTSAYASRQSLRERRRNTDLGRRVGRAVIYDIYAYAKAMESENRVPFAQAFTQSFRDVVPRLNDQDAFAVTRWLGTSLPVFRDALQKAFDQQRVKDTISATEATELIWTYLGFEAYRTFGTLVDALDAEDDARRYVAQESILIKTADGAEIRAVVVRPKNPSKPLPALLEFTIYDSQNYAKECAAHGYAGVIAYSRGKHDGSQGVVPYQHDGDDAPHGHQLDRQTALERRTRRHVWGRLQRFRLVGRREAPAEAVEGHCHVGLGGSRSQCSHGRKYFSEFRLSMVILRDQYRRGAG